MKAHKKALLTFALVISGAAVACDSATSVDPMTVRPSASVNKKTAKQLEARPGWSKACVAEKITPAGGTLTIKDGVELTVPKKAVSQPTTFAICPNNDGFLSYDFTAIDKDGQEVTTFKTPLKATFSWADAKSLPDAYRLRVLWVVNGSTEDIIAGAVDRRTKTITVNLHHFSIYAVGIE